MTTTTTNSDSATGSTSSSTTNNNNNTNNILYSLDELIINYKDVCMYGRDLRLIEENGEWINDTCINYQLKRYEELYQTTTDSSTSTGSTSISTSTTSTNDDIIFMDPAVTSFFIHQCHDDDEVTDFATGYNDFQYPIRRIIIPINDSMKPVTRSNNKVPVRHRRIRSNESTNSNTSDIYSNTDENDDDEFEFDQQDDDPILVPSMGTHWSLLIMIIERRQQQQKQQQQQQHTQLDTNMEYSFHAGNSSSMMNRFDVNDDDEKNNVMDGNHDNSTNDDEYKLHFYHFDSNIVEQQSNSSSNYTAACAVAWKWSLLLLLRLGSIESKRIAKKYFDGGLISTTGSSTIGTSTIDTVSSSTVVSHSEEQQNDKTKESQKCNNNMMITVHECPVPQQRNGYDCGVHVLMTIEAILVANPVSTENEYSFFTKQLNIILQQQFTTEPYYCYKLRQRIGSDVRLLATKTNSNQNIVKASENQEERRTTITDSTIINANSSSMSLGIEEDASDDDVVVVEQTTEETTAEILQASTTGTTGSKQQSKNTSTTGTCSTTSTVVKIPIVVNDNDNKNDESTIQQTRYFL